MLVYHRTSHADTILHDGFRDGYKLAVAPDEPEGVLEFHGVWVSADWPLDDNEGAHGEAVLAIEIPESLFVKFEWAEDGKTYREAMIPAVELNRYPRRLLADEAVEALTLRRWESWERSIAEEHPPQW